MSSGDRRGDCGWVCAAERVVRCWMERLHCCSAKSTSVPRVVWPPSKASYAAPTATTKWRIGVWWMAACITSRPQNDAWKLPPSTLDACVWKYWKLRFSATESKRPECDGANRAVLGEEPKPEPKLPVGLGARERFL